MSDMHEYGRPSKSSRREDNRQNRDPDNRSYLRHFHEKGKQEKNQLNMIFKETDTSIENILNNSMSHLEKVIQGMENPLESLNIQDIMRQNSMLKDNLSKMRKILKEKLEAGLSKQREELSQVLGNYISLITKLLQDKEELTNSLRQKDTIKHKEQQYIHKIETLKETNIKLKHALDERDEQIRIDNKKLDEFLAAIHQYQEDDLKEQNRMEAMMLRIQELESKSKSKDQLMSTSTNQKREAQDAKVQTLIQLLESTQRQNDRLCEQLSSVSQSKEQLRYIFQDQISTIQRENQEQFIEYQKAVKETLDKKDDCIERLNAVVETLKRKS